MVAGELITRGGRDDMSAWGTSGRVERRPVLLGNDPSGYRWSPGAPSGGRHPLKPQAPFMSAVRITKLLPARLRCEPLRQTFDEKG
jgi:hypothetical protein